MWESLGDGSIDLDICRLQTGLIKLLFPHDPSIRQQFSITVVFFPSKR